MWAKNRISILLVVYLVTTSSLFGQSKKYKTIGSSNESIQQIVVGDKGEYILALTEKYILQTWQVSNNSLLVSQQIDGASASISLSPDNSTLACGTSSGQVQLRSFPSLELKQTLNTEDKLPVLKTAWANQDSITVLLNDNSVSLFSVKSSRLIYNLPASEFSATSLDVSDSLNLIVVSDIEGGLSFRKLSDGQLLRTTKSHSKQIREVKIDKERNAIVTVGDDGKCQMTSIKTDYLLFKRKRYFTWLTAIDLNQKSILLTSSEGFIEIITPFNSYDLKINAVISSAKFIPTGESNQLVVCLGTLGKGIVIVKASSMKAREKLRSPQIHANRVSF
ncbi:MAG: WD40 repeat domain-containing protein [Imperialibacter sp.]|uniref:WD40 repeat domain-containing protein n=1 Tax=Imperialibacter sp. TaxID=2038411 RepID=UPI003A857ED5